MKRTYQVVSAVALVATIAPAILFLRGVIELDQAKLVMLVATVAWFVATPLWMGKPSKIDYVEVI
jgi:hypothetical protein